MKTILSMASSSSSYSTTTTIDPAISTLFPEIIQNHILTRLDGQTLAATSCTSSRLHSLATEENLWLEICNSTWPSTINPRVQNIISAFPASYRSFFSDSFPVLDYQKQLQKVKKHSTLVDDCVELISAVDIYYKSTPIFSKVAETETVSSWFKFPPLFLYLLDRKSLVPTTIPFISEKEALFKGLEEDLTLSWIVIDSRSRRAVNLSSRWPVSVERHWLTGDVHVKYAAIVAAKAGGDHLWGLFSETESVECEVMVTLGGKEGGEMYVTEVNMQMKDMEGRNLSGKDSLVILQGVMENGNRKRGKKEEGKERYHEFLEMKKGRKERMRRRERGLNMICLVIGFVMFVAFLF